LLKSAIDNNKTTNLLTKYYWNMFCRFGRRLGSTRYANQTQRERARLSNITGITDFCLFYRSTV